MSCSISFHVPKALPSLMNLSQPRRTTLLSVTSKHCLITCNANINQNRKAMMISEKPLELFNMNKTSLAVQVGAFLATVYEQPAFAITGVNYEEDLQSILIQSAIVGFLYFILLPPIIMNWLRIRWYRRNLLEMYFQFMFVFIFFPGITLWAPFLNFRKFPRDPNMKYPWSTPEDPSKIKNAYAKYPYADPEDYD